MENAKISKFYNKIFSDTVVRSELTETAKKIKNKEDLKKFIRTEIIPLARENGFSFSEEDLVDYEREALKKLKAEDLYNVSGGASFKSILMSGGILSALFLSAGLTSGQIADAFIDLQDVRESGAAMERAIINSAQQNVQPQTNNPRNGEQTQGNDYDNNNHNISGGRSTNTSNDNNSGFGNSGNTTSNDNDNNNISDGDTVNKENDNNRPDNVEVNYNNNEISVPLPKDVIENSINDNLLKIAQYSNIDIIYILTACNLFVPFIDCNYSGVMDKLRFENGYTEGIIVGAPGGDDVPVAEYNKYYGRGYPSLMTILFSSSGGNLNIAGGYPGSHPLYKICQPTPESMGKIIAFFHYYRSLSTEDQEKVQAELSMYIREIDALDETFLSKQKEFLGIKRSFYEELRTVKEHNKNASKKDKRNVKFTTYARLLKGVDKENFAAIENAEKKKSTQKQWQWNEESMNNLINGFEEEYGYYSPSAKKLIRFFNEDLKFDVVGHIDERKIDLYAFSRVMFELLSNGNYAISNQEETGNKGYDLEHERFLPKYTVEHSIGAFCVHLFNNQQDIDEYYNTIIQLCLATDSDANTNKDVSESWSKIENYRKLLETINENPNSPYKSATREHDKAYHIVKDDQGNVSFSNDTFMDCADIASRHMINLISYDKSGQEVLPNNNEDKKIKIQELSQKFVDKDVPIGNLLPPNMQQEELNNILDKFVDSPLDLSIDEKLAYLVNERLFPWHRVFGEDVLNSKREIIRLITDNVKVIVPAIEGHTSIKDLSKKEWLLHFYMHQALDPKGADADDTVTRTFWELVVSHIDKDVPEGFFPIKYVETNKVPGNELEPGFLNSLKLLYNLSYALKSDNPDLKFAETAINALENVCKNPQSDNKPDETKDTDKAKKKTKEEILQDALKATLGLFYPADNIEIEVKSFSFKNDDDCCALVNVIKKITEKEKLSFSIKQDDGHAKVIFEPVVFNKLDADLKNFVETEPPLQPFAYKFRKKLGLNIDLNDKNYKKSVKPIYWTIFDLKDSDMRYIQFVMRNKVPRKVIKTQFFQNYEALRFLRTMQGEAQNTERITREITSGCVEANIKINNKKKLLSTFIYENYVSRRDKGSPFDFFGTWESSIYFLEFFEYKDKSIETSFKKAVELARKVKIVAKDSKGTEYLYTRPRRFTSDNKEVLILPLSLDTLDTWTIPATVKINGEEFTVVGTSNGVCKVKNIIMSPGIEKFTFGSEFLSTKSINFENAQNLKSLTFGKASFSDNLLKEVIIPDKVTEISIEPGAFKECKSLETFIFPDNVTHLSIGKDSSSNSGAFFNCEKLKQVKLPANLKTLYTGTGTFRDCVSLQEFIIPEGVTELYIGTNAFIDCDSFEIIVIPSSVKKLSIPWGAVLGYTSSKKVEIPSSVVSLTLLEEDLSALKLLGCYKGIIKIPKHITNLTISKMAFFLSNLRSFEVPTGVQNVVIKEKAFWGCGGVLSKVLINASKLKMAPSSFSGCSELLKKIIGPANVNEDGLRELKSNDIKYIKNEDNNNTNVNIGPANVNEDGLRELKSNDIKYIKNEDNNNTNVNNDSNHTHNREISNVNNEGYIARLKGWFGSAISNVWNGIKSIAKWLVFWR